MGLRGRPPKTRAQHAAAGDPSKCGADKRAEPVPRSAEPQCPEYFDAEARKFWEEVAAELKALGHFYNADRAIIEAYCLAYRNLLLAEKDIQAGGIVEATLQGSKKNPAVAVMTESAKKIQELGSLLGLNPIARARIGIGRGKEAPKGGALVAFMGGNKRK